MNGRIGERIAELMNGLELTQAELARKTELPAATISRIISGQRNNPRLETLQRLAGALSVPVDCLCSRGSPLDEAIDPEIELFFSGEWQFLPEDEKDWVRRIIRMVRERRKARGSSGGQA